jgi:hypothetical protein
MSEAEPRVEEEPVNPAPTEFSLTAQQIEQQIRDSLRAQTYQDKWGYDYRNYWYVDHDENRIYAEDAQNGGLVGINYTIDGDFINVDFTALKKVKVEFVDMAEGQSTTVHMTAIERKDFDLERAKEVTTKEVEEKFSTEKAELEKAQEELTSLREFKNNSLKEEKLALIGNFSDLNEEVLKDYIENVDKFSKEELETKLFAEVGKMNLTFSKNKKQKKNEENLVVFTNLNTGGNNDVPAWFSLVEQYKSSNK